MLLVSRRKNEGLVINDNIFVTVFEIHEDKVKLAIVAPREASVHRQEVFDAIHGQPGMDMCEVWLDRVAAALQFRMGVPVGRGILEQAIVDAAIQDLGADPAG